MSTELLTILMVVTAIAVVVALFLLLWREAKSARSQFVAILAGIAVAAWATMTAILARSGRYLPSSNTGLPPVAIQLITAIVVITLCLAFSPTLRSLLTNQRNLLRLNIWRLVGSVFLALMFAGQVPALWALPAGIGDVLVGLAAFPVASRLDSPGGKRLAILFNLLGVADLVVAIGLGTATTPGPFQVLHTTPTTELMIHFPMALVPVFLVPLAFMVHFVSLWQLAGLPWVGTLTQRGTSRLDFQR